MANSPRKNPQQPAIMLDQPMTEELAMAGAVETAFAPAPALEVVPPTQIAPPAVEKAVEAPLASLKAMQDKARSFAEKGLVESQANYVKAKTAANETTSAVEASYGAAKEGVVEFNVKAIEAIKASADANFEFFKSLATAKSLTELVSLQAEFSRKQFESAVAQAKDFGALARKVANDSVAPIKAHVSKTFKVAV